MTSALTSILRISHEKVILYRFLHTKREVQDVFITSCARTPLGSMGGKLKVKHNGFHQQNIFNFIVTRI